MLCQFYGLCTVADSQLCVFVFRILEDHPIMSFTLNDTGRLALLNVATQVRAYYLPINTIVCTGQCESLGSPSLHGQTKGILTFEIFFCQSPHPHLHLLCQNSLYFLPQRWESLYFKCQNCSGSEHHCHNRLGGMSESCQKTLGCPWGPLGIHTDWCIFKIVQYQNAIRSILSNIK